MLAVVARGRGQSQNNRYTRTHIHDEIMEERSKSSRFAGMRATLSQTKNLETLGRQYGKDPNTADWLSTRKQFDRASNHNNTLLALELRQDG